jgi:hypothetical protein
MLLDVEQTLTDKNYVSSAKHVQAARLELEALRAENAQLRKAVIRLILED